MQKLVNIHEAKTQLSRLVEEAVGGETIVIAKAGKPKVILQPIPTSEDRVPGRFAGQITMSDDFDAPLSESELGHWENSSL